MIMKISEEVKLRFNEKFKLGSTPWLRGGDKAYIARFARLVLKGSKRPKIPRVKNDLYVGISSRDLSKNFYTAICRRIICEHMLQTIIRQLFCKYGFYCFIASLNVFLFIIAGRNNRNGLHWRFSWKTKWFDPTR